MSDFHKFDTEIQIEESMIQERDIYEAGSREAVEEHIEKDWKGNTQEDNDKGYPFIGGSYVEDDDFPF